MGRTAKIAGVAVLGALVLTLAIISAASTSAPGASASRTSREDTPPVAAAVPAHCRSATQADAVCTAAWETRRRHFFGKQDERR
ncbi:putative entry exclusion protein TrbK-alt [Sphingopyxis sp. R3-92]|uniref:putative entry exclusion protein TrbK-alt n=1 Tax=Sphingopyxis sp. R3-92 TaxID=3158553 RepID=UPI003EE73F9A